MKGGAIWVAGIDIGSYNGNWDRLFKQSLETLKEFKHFFLVTDGDTSILDGLAGKLKILYQHCLWHIPHQLKFALWQDRAKVKRKSPEWLSVKARIYEICSIRSGLDDGEEIQALIGLKTKMLEALVEDCQKPQRSELSCDILPQFICSVLPRHLPLHNDIFNQEISILYIFEMHF